jgi:hypothetical protein
MERLAGSANSLSVALPAVRHLLLVSRRSSQSTVGHVPEGLPPAPSPY